MNHKSTDRLTIRQMGQLALGISVIYMPLRMYALIPDFSQQLSWERIPLWTMEFIVITLFFFLWIGFIEWLQQLLFNWFDNDFLIEFKIPAQIATFIIACGMAIIFNTGFRVLWTITETALETQFGIVQKESLRSLNYRNLPQPIIKKGVNSVKKGLNALTIMAMLSAFYLASYRRAYRQLENARLKAELMEKLNLQMQFTALKNQVSPHFLFNNLSILASLVETDPKLSVQFINRLSKAYRYILEQSTHERISLKTELGFLETYTFLLNTRFKNKLQVKIHISEQEVTDYFIAPLTLQLLVENAVKHNRMSAEEPLKVTIDIVGSYLVVTNPIQRRLKPEPSTRLGLQNIIERYRLMIDSPVLIEENAVFFVVKIPLLQ